MQIIHCFMQIFMGAVSGYYTNKLAISHLFTDIPLPGGSWRAVIKKGGNKERLAQDLAEIAEDKILGEHTQRGEASYLFQELSKESVLNALDECVCSVFSELKKSEAAKKSVNEILREYFSKEPGKKLLGQAVRTAASDAKIGDFLSEQTFVSFCEDVWENDLFPEISAKKEDVLQNVFLDLSREKEPVTAERIFGKEFCLRTEEILTKKVLAILEKMNQDSERMKMEGYLHAICRQFGIGSVVRYVLLGWKEKTAGEILDPDALAEISFSKEIKLLLEQPQMYHRLELFFEAVKKELQASCLTVADLLPEGCLESEAAAEMMSGQIKKLQPFVSGLYEDNREFISERIKEELIRAIEEGTGNFLQNMVLLGAKDMILEKMEQFFKENVPEKLNHFLEDPSEETGRKLCRMLGELPVNGVLEKITFETVFAFLEKELLSGENQEKTDRYIAGKISNISLGFLLNDDVVDFVSKKADSFVPDLISDWLKGEGKETQVKNIVPVLVQKICRMPLREQGAKTLAKIVSRLTAAEPGCQQDAEKKNAFSFLYKKISEIDGRDFLEKIFKSFSGAETYFQNFGKEPEEEHLENGGKEPEEEDSENGGKEPEEEDSENGGEELLKDSCFETGKEGRKENTITVEHVISMIPVETVQKKVRALFTEKAAGYLRIKPIVQEKVLALDDDMLGSMMQKFMGTQLRPLNLIGGALGAVAGLLLFLLSPSGKITAASAALTMLCYALIGIGTNVLALHGLFRPYHIKERKWLGKIAENDGFLSKAVMGCYHLAEKIPGIRMLFCLGYIPEKKNMIAGRLADFVAENFLDPKDLLPKINVSTEMIQNFVKEQAKPMADQAVGSLRQADWEPAIKHAALSFLEHHAAGLIKKADVSFLEEPVCAFLEQEKEKPVGSFIEAEAAAEKISGYLQAQAVKMGAKPDKIMEKIREISRESGKEIRASGKEIRASGKEIGGSGKEIGGSGKEIGESGKEIGESGKEIRASGENAVFWKEKKASEYLPAQQTEFLERMAGKLYSFLWSEKFCHYAQQWLVRVWKKKARQKNRPVSSFFDGKAGTLIEKNLDGLETFFLGAIKRAVCRYLLEHEDELVEKIDQEVQNMMNDMADGMSIGGMASSMLGTRQIIAKVFHRTFVDPSYTLWEGETPEIIMQERLSDELIDRNEDRLREKIGELLEEMTRMTFGDLERILFPQEAADRADDGQTGAWISRLCRKVFDVFQKAKEQGRETVFALAALAARKAGERSMGEYAHYVDLAFRKSGAGAKILDGVAEAAKKPSLEQEMTEFFAYLFHAYLWNDSIGSFFAFSGDSAAASWKNCVELLRRQPSVQAAVKSLLSLVQERLSQETVLWREISEHGKSAEPIYEGAGELVQGMASSFSQQTQGSIYDMMEELADCMNRAFGYEGKEKAGLVSVAEEIDFARIIYLAVMDMSDRQIEDLFDGFAGQYFWSLKLSGSLGFVFGIPAVQWIAAAAALGTELLGKKKGKEPEKR